MGTYNDTVNTKILSYFRNRYGRLNKSTKGWYRMDCPFCFGKQSFGVNIFNNRCKCFKCEYNEKTRKTIAELEGKAENTVFTILENFDEVPIFEKEHHSNIRTIELPKGFRLMSMGDSFTAMMARRYMKKRGFNIDYLTYRGVGYCEDDPKYKGSIIFPLYYSDKLVYFTNRRFFMGLGTKRKFDNPSESDFGIGKNKLIYNRDALYLYKHIYLLESVINALTMGDTGIAIYGKSISDFQFSEILRSPVEKITILLDPDAIGQAINLALRLVMYKKVRLVYWEGTEDVNKLGRKKVIEVCKKFHYQPYTELNSLKIQYNYEKSSIYTHN